MYIESSTSNNCTFLVRLEHLEMAQPLLANYFRVQDECSNILVYDTGNINEDEHIGRLPSTSIAPFQPSPKWGEGHDHADPSMNLMQPFSSSSILKIFIRLQKPG